MTEIALIGKKIGMTREFYKTGQLVPVTVLKVEKARVIQVIDEQTRGYKAVQLGFGKIKSSKLSKSMKGFYTKKNTEAKKKLKEFRVENTENYKEGNEFGLEIFKEVKFVEGHGIDINWTDTSTGSDADPYDLTFTITGLTTSEIAAGTLVIESEGIASNDNDTTIPTSAAVKDYVDSQSSGVSLGVVLALGG